MSILIVEHDTNYRKIIDHILKISHYKTEPVNSTTDALNILRTKPEIEVVISEIIMPEINGLELLRTIRNSTFISKIPVILCTASKDIGKLNLAATIGCKYYILKPFNQKLLLEKVALAISKSELIIATTKEITHKNKFSEQQFKAKAEEFVHLMEKEKHWQANNKNKIHCNNNIKHILEIANILGAQQLINHIEQKNKNNSHLYQLELNWIIQRTITKIKEVL